MADKENLLKNKPLPSEWSKKGQKRHKTHLRLFWPLYLLTVI